jgi:hypothetical protein
MTAKRRQERHGAWRRGTASRRIKGAENDGGTHTQPEDNRGRKEGAEGTTAVKKGMKRREWQGREEWDHEKKRVGTTTSSAQST